MKKGYHKGQELIMSELGLSLEELASNPPPKDWYPLFPNPVLAEGILDRLINKAHHQCGRNAQELYHSPPGN